METTKKTQTLGAQLVATQKEHENSSPIEAGDMVNESGKKYMQDLFECVETHRTLVDEFYIQVIYQKPIWFGTRVIHLRFIARHTKPFMEDAMDVWYVNNKTDELKLLWSLPHHSLFNFYLAHEHEVDPQLIHWIKIYTKAQKK